MMRKMNLQFFADPAGDGDGGEQPAGADQGQQTGQTPTVDYAKIQQMLEGTLAAKEETALKAYFKQQGLSEEEMKQAVAAFKAEKAKNQPDVNGMQEQLAQAQKEAQKARIDSAASLAAIGLGLDAKTVPYVLKMADLSQVCGADGKINEETLKNALNQVLEDVPALKPQAADTTGFVQVGAGGGTQKISQDEQLAAIFGNKK